MCAYIQINGTFCSEYQLLLTDVLRNEWGFDGIVMSDWAIVSDTFKATPDVVNAITQYSPEIMRVNSIFGVLNISDLPLSNGWWPGVLIPILSGLSQFVSMKISMANQPQQTNQNGMMGNMKVMNAVMILFSVYICFTLNIGIGLYWIANAVLRTIVMVITNRIIDKKGLDAIIEENKAKQKKKKEKRGDKPSKFEEYAKMSTKKYDEAAPQRKSIKELAATSTMTKEEKNSGSKAQNSQNKPAQTEQKKDETASKSGKKNKNDAGNIAQIAHMLDGSNNKKK